MTFLWMVLCWLGTVRADVDGDFDGYLSRYDCDDDDPDIHPNAIEDCADGIDNDCDSYVDGSDLDCDDTEVADSGVPDSGLPDSGLPDSGLPDSGLPDSGDDEADTDTDSDADSDTDADADTDAGSPSDTGDAVTTAETAGPTTDGGGCGLSSAQPERTASRSMLLGLLLLAGRRRRTGQYTEHS